MLAVEQAESDRNREKRGVDIWLIRSNLKLSHEDRISQHQNTLDCIFELHRMRMSQHAKSAKTTRISGQESS